MCFVQGLSFRKGSHQLFSASQDKLVKVWNVDEMAFVETLYVLVCYMSILYLM